jgi:cobalt-zinc-cadmium efflux system membrane fusion protein
MPRLLVLWVIATLSLFGCRDDTTEKPTSTAAAAPAVAGAMCKEHGVLEAVCTKCNPALIPVFKAKGDWCEEHGFPESFCPICHPDRGGKPTADVSSTGDGPADGTKVRFRSKETARLAGLHFATATERAASREVVVTARVVYDATRVAQINPRLPGVVRAIESDVGAAVKEGTLLATIESASVGAEQSRWQAAKTALDVAENNFSRVETLQSEGISSERELLVAQREREEARAELRSTQALLGMVGANAGGGARYTLKSPIAGVVTQRNATIGRLVDAEDIVFEIVDPSSMWIELDVPETDLSLVNGGEPVVVTLDGVPGREFAGTLSYVAPAIDPRTRTAIARFQLANPDGVLRANLFGQGRIAVSDPRAAVWVPKAAVQRAKSESLVFVRLAEDAFEARVITGGPEQGELISVAGRIQAGDEVVTEGSFLLKTETLKESMGAGCCEVD